jgi:response regulator of citrate/malate metabolism
MYSSKEVAEILVVSDKSVRRYLNSYFSLENGAYQVSEKMLEVLKNEYLGQDADTIVQPFTADEYEEFRKRLTEYPMFKKHIESLQTEIEYHKNQYESLMALHREFVKMQEKALDNLTQRSFIEAKEKGFDK